MAAQDCQKSRLLVMLTNADKEISIAASRGFSELTKNVIKSSHGYSTPSLKISRKSVQPFSHNLADKETNKQRKKSIEIENNTPSPIYRGRGNNQNQGQTKNKHSTLTA